MISQISKLKQKTCRFSTAQISPLQILRLHMKTLSQTSTYGNKIKIFLCKLSSIASIISDRLQYLCNTVQTAIPNTFTVHYTNNLQGKIKRKETSINTAFRISLTLDTHSNTCIIIQKQQNYGFVSINLK